MDSLSPTTALPDEARLTKHPCYSERTSTMHATEPEQFEKRMLGAVLGEHLAAGASESTAGPCHSFTSTQSSTCP